MKGHTGHGEHTGFRSTRYIVLLGLLLVSIVLMVSGARYTMDHSFQSRYVLWGQASAPDPYKDVAQHWGLEGPHPWRARIHLRGGRVT